MARLLVAEDYDDFRELLADYLRARGHDVIEARNGAEAIEAARLEHPDAIVMDLMMPVRDGASATRELKASSATRGIPVVAVTAAAPRGVPAQEICPGCDALVSKPVDFGTLLGTLATLLRS
ncbi:response regulator [Sandaracinus amylolyticus]|uniref:response regulator n=1 Tax=Sandaracinus amylolyticus TaxID=927083 RepID=UPI001F175AC5|nr:response regulator [Sandaracinus amylolyticus]UJR83267.1 Hypothetical protein I5071_53340 [Sandaracinus amylolyticus]